MPERQWLDNVVLGVKQESAYGTALDFADLLYRLSYSGEKRAITGEYRSDRAYLGKGTNHTTVDREVRRDARWTPEFFLSTLSGGLAAGLVLGALAESGSGPYVSVFTEQDAASSEDAISTTVYTEDGAAKGRLHGCSASQAAYRWRQGEDATVALSLIGSGEETAGAHSSLPDVTVPNTIIGANVTTEIGPQGGSYTDFTSNVFEGSVTLSQVIAEALGYGGNGLYRTRSWFSEYRHRFDIRLLKDGSTTIRDWARNRTMLQARFTFTHNANEKIVILFPGCKLLEPRTVAEQGFNAQDVSPGDDGVFVDGNGTPDEAVEVTVTHPADYGFLAVAS
ncbi:MAG: hypothetical protein GC160_02940 [Acidobacteria bacterium]|nr:hypothetical protein [Acidobacteriota bacterium]